MSEDRSVTDLVTRATNGDKRAWDDLVERYAPLVWSICRRRQLSETDANEVQQSVWLQLVSQLGKIRDSVALAAWLAAATQRECGRVRNAAPGPRARGPVPDPGASRTSRAEWRSRNCWQLNGTLRCARRSLACPPAASS